jgi:hypothetical protein
MTDPARVVNAGFQPLALEGAPECAAEGIANCSLGFITWKCKVVIASPLNQAGTLDRDQVACRNRREQELSLFFNPIAPATEIGRRIWPPGLLGISCRFAVTITDNIEESRQVGHAALRPLSLVRPTGVQVIIA